MVVCVTLLMEDAGYVASVIAVERKTIGKQISHVAVLFYHFCKSKGPKEFSCVSDILVLMFRALGVKIR